MICNNYRTLVPYNTGRSFASQIQNFQFHNYITMARNGDRSLAVDFDLFANLEAYDGDNISESTVSYPGSQVEAKIDRKVRFEDFITRNQSSSVYFRPTSTERNYVRRREEDMDRFIDWYDYDYAPRMVATSDEETEIDLTPQSQNPFDQSPERKVRGRQRARRDRTRSRSPYVSTPPTLTRETTQEFPDLTYTSPLRFTVPLNMSPQTSPLQPLNFDE
jgi:hypothetical protein